MEPNDLIAQWIDKVRGKKCWGVSAGGCVGTAFDLKIGGMIERSRPLTNPHLPRAQQLFDSEYSLFVQDSPWELAMVENGEPTLVVDSRHDACGDGSINRGLQNVVGTTIRLATFTMENHELRLIFDDRELTLKVAGMRDEGCDEYSLFLPSVIINMCGVTVQTELRELAG
jgi:hypothetical protein